MAIRVTVNIPIEPPVIGIGDHPEKKQAERLAALSGVYQLHEMGIVRWFVPCPCSCSCVFPVVGQGQKTPTDRRKD